MSFISRPIILEKAPRGYGSWRQPLKGDVLVEEFTRASLNPTDFPAYYTTGGVGTPATTITSGELLELITSAGINDTANLVLDGLGFSLDPWYVDNKSQIIFNAIIQPVDVASLQIFVGLHTGVTALTALPTTNIHLGIYVDQGVSNNYILTSGNGAAQSTTDTGVAIDTTRRRVEIIRTGVNEIGRAHV